MKYVADTRRVWPISGMIRPNGSAESEWRGLGGGQPVKAPGRDECVVSLSPADPYLNCLRVL